MSHRIHALSCNCPACQVPYVDLASKSQRTASVQEAVDELLLSSLTDVRVGASVATHPLYPVLMSAIAQAMHGKGQRHGGASVPFLEQPIFHYAKMHGRGFLTGQAAKKLEEAASTRHGEAFETEVLGAIVYAAAAILRERREMDAEKAAFVQSDHVVR